MHRKILQITLGTIVIGISLFSYSINIEGQDQNGKATGSGSLPGGQELYHSKCSPCHGDSGKGDGPIAAYLNPRPRDFTSGKFKIRSTESGSIPTDADIERTITKGLHGTAMPDWGSFITTDRLPLIIQYLKSFSSKFQTEKPKVIISGKLSPTSPASIEAGRKVYEKLQCGKCHGDQGDGKGTTVVDLKDDWDRPISPTKLNEPWTFKGGSSPDDIYMRFRTGMDGSPMPSFVGAASDKEMGDLTNYVVSLRRKPVWDMTADELKAFYNNQEQKTSSDPVKHGKYLVETHGCGFCHTPVNADGSVMEGLELAGGQKNDLSPFGVFYTYNLTSDKETGLGNWSDDQIRNAITRGLAGKGWHMLPFPMPWVGYAQLTDTDVNAIIAYLRTIPPINNRIPPPERPNIFVYLWQKFEFLILKKDIPGKVYPGNWGTFTKQLADADQHVAGSKATEVKP